jgi:hypothetical protein
MNGFDVRALGWVVTRDACAEMLRVAFGGWRRAPQAVLVTLGTRWRAVLSSIRADRSKRLDVSMIMPLVTPLSKESEMALVEFVDQLDACYPELYSEQVLRSRYLKAWARFITSAAFAAILANLTSSTIPVFGDAALVLLLIAGLSFVMTFQLWRVRRLVMRIRQHRSWPKRTPAIHEQATWPATKGSPNT